MVAVCVAGPPVAGPSVAEPLTLAFAEDRCVDAAAASMDLGPLVRMGKLPLGRLLGERGGSPVALEGWLEDGAVVCRHAAAGEEEVAMGSARRRSRNTTRTRARWC